MEDSKDLISRQAALDAIIEDKIPDELLKIMTATGDGDKAKTLNMTCDRHAKMLMSLPSAQPEIIRCKDCKYWHREIHNGIEYFNFSSCDLNRYGDGHNFYCADAERRTDG